MGQLSTLLWKNFKYCRRHPIKTALFFLFPILLSSLILLPVSLIKTDDIPDCDYQTVALAPSRPEMIVGSLLCQEEYECIDTSGQYSPPHELWLQSKAVELLGLGGLSEMCAGFTEDEGFALAFRYWNMFCDKSDKDNDKKIKYGDLATAQFVFKGKLYYYVRDGADQTVADEIMELLQDYLDPIASLTGKEFVNLSKPICFTPLANRTFSAQSEEKAIEMARKLDENKEFVWGMIEFISTSKHYQYKILTHYHLREEMSTLYLQSLIEAAIIERESGERVLLEHKLLPKRCRKNTAIYGASFDILSIVIGLGFVILANTVASETCFEKQAGLLEFLFIAGVPRWKVKIAWFIFGSAFFISIAILVCLIFKLVSSSLLEYSDFSLVLIMMILYSLSLLCFCFFIASLSSTAQRAGILVFVILMASYLLPQWAQLVPDIGYKGGKLMLVKIVTFFVGPVAAQIGFAYVYAWEEIEKGATWSSMADSPNAEDQYGGIAEVMIYFILQCPMYMLLSWYFEKVAPSKYGIKWPFYFCCMPSFWGCSERHHSYPSDELDVNRADIEPLESEKTLGISVQNLTKSFGKGKLALNKLSVTFYQNEITALLGHNGAGKSTTMNMLTGMITPTAGTATVSGFDIWENMKEVRQTLGFCPQYDIIYPELTVTEHMLFYGDLKGIPRDEVQKHSTQLFEQMKMMHALDTAAMSLSGGMKRKLSIAIAFIGSPTTVILDEPTSAIDPFSRRAIWDAVLQYRSKATVLISTHYMQEADVLGDRIAIINGGELKCFGTPMYLKSRYGDGSKITVAHDGDIDEKALQAELQAFVPANLQSHSLTESTFSIPIEAARSEKLVDCFKCLEENGDQWKVLSFGITESTMEQVFFNVAETSNEVDDGNPPAVAELQPESMLGKVEYEKHHGCSLLMMQLWATWVKRFHLSKRSVTSLMFQVFVPLVFMAILLFLNNSVASAGIGGETLFMHPWNTTSAPRNAFFFAGESDQELLNVLSDQGLGTRCVPTSLLSTDNVKTKEADMGYECLNLNNVSVPEATEDGKIHNCDCSRCAEDAVLSANSVTVNSNDTMLNLLGRNVTNYLLKTNEKGIIGGIEKFALNLTSYIEGLKSSEEFGSELSNMNISLSDIPPGLIGNFTQVYRIWTGVKVIDEGRPTEREIDMYDMKMSFLNAFSNAHLKALKSNSKDYGITLYTEEQSMNRDLSIAQAISGILLGFFGHFALMMPTFTILLVIVNEKAAGNKQLQILMGLNKLVYWLANFVWDMVIYLLSVCLMIAFMAIWPKIFDTDLKIFFLISMMYGCSMILLGYVMSFLIKTARNAIMIIGNASPFVAMACLVLFFFRDKSWHENVNISLDFLPPYFITEALIEMQINKMTPDAKHVLSWDVLGKRFVLSGLFSLLMVTLLLCFESGVFGSIYQCMMSNKSAAVTHSEAIAEKDPDVANEEEKILNQTEENQALVVSELVKSYGKHVAVKGVSFGVKKGECFGLLGVNGAGKTTLFKMLTRFHGPTHGDAKILGLSVFARPGEAAKHMSYCPQEDCIFETLTTGEHLHLYGRIRGIPGEHREEVIELLTDEVGLTPHRKKQSHALSGGNKRKLNFAISMIDFPDVIFLDEMTTGMDPKARRAAWTCLEYAVSRGCAAVITSHSMEECEALCNRIVIMVNGTFKCIGGIQYLKDKYGNNYNMKFRLGKNGDVQKLNQAMVDKFAQSKVVEEHLGYLELQVPAESIKLSLLFEAIHAVKNDCGVDEFSVSQTTLEHVFVNMVRDQE